MSSPPTSKRLQIRVEPGGTRGCWSRSSSSASGSLLQSSWHSEAVCRQAAGKKKKKKQLWVKLQMKLSFKNSNMCVFIRDVLQSVLSYKALTHAQIQRDGQNVLVHSTLFKLHQWELWRCHNCQLFFYALLLSGIENNSVSTISYFSCIRPHLSLNWTYFNYPTLYCWAPCVSE